MHKSKKKIYILLRSVKCELFFDLASLLLSLLDIITTIIIIIIIMMKIIVVIFVVILIIIAIIIIISIGVDNGFPGGLL